MIMKEVATKGIVNVVAYMDGCYRKKGHFCKCNKCGSLMLLFHYYFEDDDYAPTCINCKSEDISNVDNRYMVSIDELKTEGYKLKSCMEVEDCEAYLSPQRKMIACEFIYFEEMVWRITDFECVKIKEVNGCTCFYNADNEEIPYLDVHKKISEFLGEQVLDVIIEHNIDEDGDENGNAWLWLA